MNLALNNPERLTTLDVSKGLGILLVIFAHVNLTPELLVYIYSFHMPLFFIISGMFFKKNKYTFPQFIKNRFFRLICPYIFFYSIILIAYFALDFLSYGISSQLFKSIKEPFIQLFISQGSSKVISPPLWFVPCLFVVEIIYFFISKLKIHFLIPVCSMSVAIGWILATKFPAVSSYLPWSLDSALFAIGFYAIGNLCASYFKKSINNLQNHKYKIPISLALAVICFLVIIPLAFFNGKVSIGSQILNNGFLFYLTGIIGSIGIIAISTALHNVKFLSYLGKNTFCIMAVHYTISVFLIKVIQKIGFSNYDITNFIHTIIPFFVTLGFSLAFVVIYNYLKSKLSSQKTAQES